MWIIVNKDVRYKTKNADFKKNLKKNKKKVEQNQISFKNKKLKKKLERN